MNKKYTTKICDIVSFHTSIIRYKSMFHLFVNVSILDKKDHKKSNKFKKNKYFEYKQRHKFHLKINFSYN